MLLHLALLDKKMELQILILLLNKLQLKSPLWHMLSVHLKTMLATKPCPKAYFLKDVLTFSKQGISRTVFANTANLRIMLNLEVFKTGGQNDNKAFKHTTCNRYFLSIGASVQRKLNYQRFFTVDRVYQSMLGPFKTSELIFQQLF